MDIRLELQSLKEELEDLTVKNNTTRFADISDQIELLERERNGLEFEFSKYEKLGMSMPEVESSLIAGIVSIQTQIKNLRQTIGGERMAKDDYDEFEDLDAEDGQIKGERMEKGEDIEDENEEIREQKEGETIEGIEDMKQGDSESKEKVQSHLEDVNDEIGKKAESE